MPNVEVLWDTVVERIEGEDAVEAVILKNAKTGQESRLETAGVFIAVGIRPNIEGIPSYIEQDEAGYIIAAEDGVTNTSGVFVAGDLRTKPLRQIVTAVADGANAITSVQKYLLEAGV